MWEALISFNLISEATDIECESFVDTFGNYTPKKLSWIFKVKIQKHIFKK